MHEALLMSPLDFWNFSSDKGIYLEISVRELDWEIFSYILSLKTRLIEFFSKLLFVLLLARQMSANVIKHYRELSNNDDIYKTGVNSSVIMWVFCRRKSIETPFHHSVWSKGVSAHRTYGAVCGELPGDRSGGSTSNILGMTYTYDMKYIWHVKFHLSTLAIGVDWQNKENILTIGDIWLEWFGGITRFWWQSENQNSKNRWKQNFQLACCRTIFKTYPRQKD